MASFLSRLAPLVLTLRGSHRIFSSAQRTLDTVERLRRRPRPFEPPAVLSKTVEVSRRDVDGWPVYYLSPPGQQPARRALYLHGGCYVFQIDPVHWSVIGALVVQAGVTVVVPIMPLAPEGTASVIVARVVELAASVVHEVGADNLSIVGDSSGGGMALAVAMGLRDRGLAPLRATVLIAPWLDISVSDPMIAQLAPRDPWLAAPGVRAAGALYRGELGEQDWRVSPIHGSLQGLGPVTLFSGTRDILHADALRLLPLAAAAGLTLDYHQGEGMVHNYPILPMPEGDAARELIAAAVS